MVEHDPAWSMRALGYKRNELCGRWEKKDKDGKVIVFVNFEAAYDFNKSGIYRYGW